MLIDSRPGRGTGASRPVAGHLREAADVSDARADERRPTSPPAASPSDIQPVIELDRDELAEWERVISQPPRDALGLRAFVERFESPESGPGA